MSRTLAPAVLTLALFLAPAARATDRDDVRPGTVAFAAIDGVDGESTQKGHEKQVEVLSISQTFRNAGTTGGGGAGAGKVTLSPFTITKLQDSASVKLMDRCVKGTHVPSIVLHLYRQSGDGKAQAQEYYRVTLKEVFITAINERSADGRIVDEVQLSFAEGRWETFDPPAVATFNAQTNTLNVAAPAGGTRR